MMALLLLAPLLQRAAAAPCPAGTVEMGSTAGRTVCEDLSRINGFLLFMAADSATGDGGGDTWLHKRLYAQNTAPTFGNVSGGLQTLNQAEDDLLGKK